MELREAAHERQPEAEPAVRSGARAIVLAETLADVRQQLRADPHPGVAHRDRHLRIHALQLHLHPTALRRELHRVAEQVPHHLLETVGIAADRADRRGEHRLQPDVLGRRRGPDAVHRLLDHESQIHRLDGQTDLAGLDARDVEQVVHQADLGGDVSQDDLQRAPRLLGVEVAPLEDGGPAVHRIERGAQLMREGGQELVLGPAGRLRGLARRLRVAIQARVVPRHRRLAHHRLREEQIGGSVPALGLGDREGHRAEDLFARDHGHHHPRRQAELTEEIELLRSPGRPVEIGRGRRRHDRGPAIAQHRGHAVGRGRAEAVPGARLVGDALLGGIDVSAGNAADRAVRIEQVDGAQVAEEGHGEPGHPGQHSLVFERSAEGGRQLPEKERQSLYWCDKSRLGRSLVATGGKRRPSRNYLSVVRPSAASHACWVAISWVHGRISAPARASRA